MDENCPKRRRLDTGEPSAAPDTAADVLWQIQQQPWQSTANDMAVGLALQTVPFAQGPSFQDEPSSQQLFTAMGSYSQIAPFSQGLTVPTLPSGQLLAPWPSYAPYLNPPVQHGMYPFIAQQTWLNPLPGSLSCPPGLLPQSLVYQAPAVPQIPPSQSNFHQQHPPTSAAPSLGKVVTPGVAISEVVAPAVKGLELLAEAPLPPAASQKKETQLITSISAKWEQHGLGVRPSGRFPVKLLSSSKFCLPDNDKPPCGKIASDHGQLVHGLLEETTLKLYVSCLIDEGLTAKKTSSRISPILSCHLDITVYGPEDLFDDIGSWFEDHVVYLQDPIECHDDVPYHNPQKLSSETPAACLLVSELVAQFSQLTHLQNIPEQPDLLDILSSHSHLEEAEQPLAIETQLKSHQKKALTFMIQRELGWSYSSAQPDMWELVDSGQGRVFLNRISEVYQKEEPPNFSGGIIADPMGLGKTLTMIALVATDLISYPKQPVDTNAICGEEENEKLAVTATLVIIPPPLIGTWEEQLEHHVLGGTLVWRRHHGKFKLTSVDELRGVHIVLTSYHTVSAEYKAGRDDEDSQSVLFSVRWRRIILDEAHFIRNRHARMAKTVCALDSVSRWAVTGTPIQNRLSDLATLLSFVRAHPYTDPKRFDADISRLWKSGEDEKAAKRLKTLSTYLLLRRPKATIELPTRRDQICPVELSNPERELYNGIRTQVLSRIDEALHRDSESSRAGVYVNALQKIESLRLVCDLGVHYHARPTNESSGNNNSTDASAQSVTEEGEWARNAQNVFNTQRDLGPIVCLQCSSTLELTETFLDDAAAAAQHQPTALLSRCLKFLCNDCTKKQRPSTASTSNRRIACGHQPSCSTALVSTSSIILEEVPDHFHKNNINFPENSGLGSDADSSFIVPSKVEALLADLQTLPTDTKCIVFSTWRLTLDIIKRGLDKINIGSIRFDGKVPQKDRQMVVGRFRTDPKIRVMLLTLSCGAVGLTLTVATRAYLMEPHWNPTLEEQALARIHRLGQTKEVTTVRFFVRDSFEEQIIKLQESKKHLAGILLSHHDTGQAEDNLEGLHKLRSLL